MAFVAAGTLSAKDADLNKDNDKGKKEQKASAKEAEAKKFQCMNVGILIECTNEVLDDTVCWGEGSGTATYEQAYADHIHNAQLLTEYLCGGG